tara:strand:+ start:761 stop:2302 length:1542 start_codon:yes stop_codon:yes gene_type:complete
MVLTPLTPVDRFAARILFHDNFTRALFLGDVKEVLIQIIDKGADVNAKPKGILVLSDATPLSMASSYGHLEVVQILLAAGADVNKKNNDILGWSNPLYGAADEGYVDTVQCLLDAGADVNSIGGKDRNTALLIAVKEKYLNVVQALLTAGANVNLTNKYGESPLLCASDNGHVEMVQALLGAQSDVNKADNAGQTPLIMASRKGHLEVVRILLKAGADINKIITARDSVLTMGRDALSFACERKHWEIVEILLNAGANVNIQTYDGVTAAHIINKEGKMELLHTCLDAGADLHSGHYGGSNKKLITTFVTNGNLEKFSLLLNRVADKEIRNIGDNLNFDTLFFEAIFVEDLDILELLFRKFHPKVILDYSKEFGVSSRYDELKIKIDNFKFDNNYASWSKILPEIFGVRDISNEKSYSHVEIHKNWSYKKSKLEKIAQQIINERTSYINVLRQINLDNFTQVNCENMRKYKAIFYIEFRDPVIIMRERLDILTFGSKGFPPEQPISKHIYEYL